MNAIKKNENGLEERLRKAAREEQSMEIPESAVQSLHRAVRVRISERPSRQIYWRWAWASAAAAAVLLVCFIVLRSDNRRPEPQLIGSEQPAARVNLFASTSDLETESASVETSILTYRRLAEISPEALERRLMADTAFWFENRQEPQPFRSLLDQS
jgi:anti-sigma-K factor RskA